MVDLDKLQKEIYQNKINHGFDIRDNHENMYKQFCFIQGEIAEAFDAYHKNLGTLGEELADVCLYILGMCEIKGISLEKEILSKFEKIKKRKYVNVNGTLIKEECLKDKK